MNTKQKWPTLEGRLNQPLTTELEALEQLETMIPLSDHGKRRLKILQSKNKNSFATNKKM
jgi:hypothetical protein